MVLVSSISNFFTNKTSLANKWSFSSSNLALANDVLLVPKVLSVMRNGEKLQW